MHLTAQLQVVAADIYSSNFPSQLASAMPNFQDLVQNKHLEGTSHFQWTVNSLAFQSFTKAPSWGADLYEDLVRPAMILCFLIYDLSINVH